MIRDEVWRSPPAVLAADAFVAWLLIRSGLTRWALVWLALSSAVSIGRAIGARHTLSSSGLDADKAVRLLMGWFLAVGLTRTWPIAIAFQASSNDMHYLITMVMMGLAAGGVGTAVGFVPMYLAWSAPVGLALVLGWLSQGTVEGVWIAMLLLLMFALLTLYVRDFGRILEKEIRQRDELERQRERADLERDRAEQAVEARTRFFETASHDLRQPLGSLRFYGDAVAVHARRLEHEQLVSIASGIGRALDRVEPLVRMYLDVAQLDASTVRVNPQPCDVASMLENTRDAFANLALREGLTLSVRIADGLDETVIQTDERLLRGILDNLTGNAIKFTRVGGVELNASRQHMAQGEYVRIAVIDTGVGIPESERDRIFDDFYQVANPGRTSGQGVGLGLGIARRQAELIGAKLRVSANDGRGTTFFFDLPIAGGQALVAQNPLSMTQQLDRPLSVLVIDDELEVQTSLRLMLEAVGARVETAYGLRDAQALLHTGFDPSALVADYRLDGQTDGLRVIDALAREGYRIPSVVITGDTSPQRLEALSSAGIPVLHKPVSGEKLLASLLAMVPAKN